MTHYTSYFRFIKIEHTLFSLPVVFSGTALALKTLPVPALSWRTAGWIFLAAAGARSFGFGVNRIIDREIDAKNSRTKMREIPAGVISVKSAWIFSGVSAAVFIFSAGQISRACLFLSPIPLLFFLVYPFLKRWTVLCHLWLGFAWGTAPLGGWIAVRTDLFAIGDLRAVLLLFFFCVFWVAGFDMIYALLDEDFDRSAGLHSIPAVFGGSAALRISEFCHLAAFIFLGSLVAFYLRGACSFALLSAAGLLLIVSHWRIKKEPLTPELIDFAFFKVNAAIGFLVFLIVVV